MTTLYTGYDFSSRPTTLELIEQRRADVTHAQQVDRVIAKFAELKRRSPDRHEAARLWACDHVDDMAALEMFADQELTALDETEAQRKINDLADERRPELTAAITYYQGE